MARPQAERNRARFLHWRRAVKQVSKVKVKELCEKTSRTSSWLLRNFEATSSRFSTRKLTVYRSFFAYEIRRRQSGHFEVKGLVEKWACFVKTAAKFDTSNRELENKCMRSEWRAKREERCSATQL